MATSCALKPAKSGRIKVGAMQTWGGKTWSSPFFRYTFVIITRTRNSLYMHPLLAPLPSLLNPEQALGKQSQALVCSQDQVCQVRRHCHWCGVPLLVLAPCSPAKQPLTVSLVRILGPCLHLFWTRDRHSLEQLFNVVHRQGLILTEASE